ncbi:hypothetical protein CEXT_58001 [Caerostris extrusa]|uniref:Uncharacterized protein n=1 Tax=Caerostris extrusa TaxID=172846 RepID=A0AAV4R003_CAEEX|nr:hypothetical protein CEXT_58001 [Caerostris extrusa]
MRGALSLAPPAVQRQGRPVQSVAIRRYRWLSDRDSDRERKFPRRPRTMLDPSDGGTMPVRRGPRRPADHLRRQHHSKVRRPQ